MRINEVTYGKLKTPLKVNGNLNSIKEKQQLKKGEKITILRGRRKINFIKLTNENHSNNNLHSIVKAPRGAPENDVCKVYN